MSKIEYEVKRVGTYYCVVEKDTGRKHSEHTTMDRAKNMVAYLGEIDGKAVMGTAVKYKHKGV